MARLLSFNLLSADGCPVFFMQFGSYCLERFYRLVTERDE